VLFPSANSHKLWLLFLAVVLVLAHLYFHLQFEGTEKGRGRWIDRSLIELMSPVQRAVSWAEGGVSSTAERIQTLWDAQEELAAMQSQMAHLVLESQRLAQIELENNRLRELLGFQRTEAPRLMAARVVAQDRSLFFRTVEIDRGTTDGVLEGMAVVHQAGAVGRVLRVSTGSSTVLMVTDLNSRVDGVVERSRTQVIVSGSAQGDLKLSWLPRRADVQQGDVIVTSGLGNVFPPGYRVGTVTVRAEDPDFVLEEAGLEPAVNFGSLEDVFVVLAPARGTARGP
jgi:rod shape-determining protein MreC